MNGETLLNPDATIAALLTPLAPGAIAVIGLTGPQTDSILRRVLRRAGRASKPSTAASAVVGSGSLPASEQARSINYVASTTDRRNTSQGLPILVDRRPAFCRLVDEGETLDDVVVVRISHPGTILAEINTHGGVRIAQRALLLLEKHGAAVVSAEDFAARLEQIVIVPSPSQGEDWGEGYQPGLLGPSDAVERDVDHALLGVSSRRLTSWLLRQRAILPQYLARLASLEANGRAAFVERSHVAIRLLQGLRVALIGPPNAGKSTLANRLIGADRVVTSDQPGTTRDWVEETALIQGWPVALTDTAGLRQPACPIEAEAVARSRARARLADLVVVVLDVTQPPDVRGRQMGEADDAIPPGRPRIVVLNKCDLLNPRAPAPIVGSERIDQPLPLRISALSGLGLDEFERRIESLLGLDRLDESRPTGFLPHHLTIERGTWDS